MNTNDYKNLRAIGIDIDGTTTKHPEFFRFMVHSCQFMGVDVYFVTARPEKDRQITIDQMIKLGFDRPPHDLENWTNLLHMYPGEYAWPWTSTSHELTTKRMLARWKIQKCQELGVDMLIDDCVHVKIAAAVAGMGFLHVPGT